VKGGLLTHMLITKEMSLEEIYANVTEMLLAGVDTVCVCRRICAERKLKCGELQSFLLFQEMNWRGSHVCV